MMHRGEWHTAKLLLVVVALSSLANAAKVSWATLLGANRQAKIVWQKQANGLPEKFNPVNTTIMAFDTRDNSLRTLVGGATSKTDPTFTWDGNRVVYFMPNSEEIGVVNWDGTNSRKISGTYAAGWHCWRSGTKDYVLAVIGNNLYKVNIDDPTEKPLVYTGTSSSGISGVSWASMSPDGNLIAGVFPMYPNVGVASVGASSYKQFNPGGCWPTMARDGSNQILYTIEPHTNIRIVQSNGTTQVLDKKLTNIYDDGGSSEYEALRWTPDSDILTCISFLEGSGPGENVCKGANPKIVKISTLDWASPNTGVSGVEGNTDVFFYSGSSTVTPLASKASAVLASTKAGQTYDVRGRSLSPARASEAGVHVSVVADARQGARCFIAGR